MGSPPMNRYRLTDELASLIRKLHPTLKVNIKHALELMGENPSCGKLLKEELANLRSYRVKKYRIIYRVIEQDNVLEIIAIGPRKNIYEETFQIISKGVK